MNTDTIDKNNNEKIIIEEYSYDELLNSEELVNKVRENQILNENLNDDIIDEQNLNEDMFNEQNLNENTLDEQNLDEDTFNIQNADDKNDQIEIENNNSNCNNVRERKKRGLPKTFLANQQKYLEALEKQQKMLNSRKDKNKNNKLNKKNKDEKIIAEPDKKNVTNNNTSNMRRVIIGGKFKYLPIKSEEFSSSDKITKQINRAPSINKQLYNEDNIPIFKKRENNSKSISSSNTNMNDSVTINNEKKMPPQKTHSRSNTSLNKNIPLKKIHSKNNINLSKNNDETVSTKKIPSGIAKKMEINKILEKQTTSFPKKNKTLSGKKIPSKYAKQIENDVKQQTVKNIKNFSDLRRIKALQDIDPDTNIDANKASITELRKLRTEQRKREHAELQKRMKANKRESAIQEILRNDKMNKFSQTLAIKNLSVSSRNRRPAKHTESCN